MRFKILALGLICIFIFAYCKSPVAPEPPIPPDEPLLPIIEYFRASQSQVSPGESSTLSWNTINASQVLMFCWDGVRYPGICVVEKTGTKEVWPERTITYRLTAYSGANSVSEYITVELVLGQP